MGRPIQTPTGTAPRSSTTGMAEMVANTAHFGNPKFMKKLAIFCPVCRCSVVSLAAAKAGDVMNVRDTRPRAAAWIMWRTWLFFVVVFDATAAPSFLEKGLRERFKAEELLTGGVGRPLRFDRGAEERLSEEKR